MADIFHLQYVRPELAEGPFFTCQEKCTASMGAARTALDSEDARGVKA